jgi:hypothetical protein
MFGTISGDPSRNDLSPFRNEISKDSRIPIVDIQLFIRAESTDLRRVEETSQTMDSPERGEEDEETC